MITVIENKRRLSLGLRELLVYRELVFALALRDFRIRYSQAVLGLAWAVLQPVLTLGVLYVVFAKFARVNTGHVPYLAFIMVGMSAWGFFSYVLSQAGNSIIGAQNLVTKVYFPRLVIPVSRSITGLIDLFIGLLLFSIICLAYGFVPPVQILYLPLVILPVVLLALAAGIWISALSIRFRDVQYMVPFIVQIGLYATPIAYPVSFVPDEWRWLLYLNPMTSLMECMRWCMLGTPLPDAAYLIAGVAVTLFLFLSGLAFFKRVENQIADII